MTTNFIKTILARKGFQFIGIQKVPRHLGSDLILYNEKSGTTKALTFKEFYERFLL